MNTTSVRKITRPSDAIAHRLDELLMMWHRHREGYKLSRGYADQDATCRDYRAPTHWDWQNGATQARADALEVEAVDAAMELVPNTPRRWNTALAFEARNLCSGAVVWTSPVLPKDREEREVLVLEARNLLLVQLLRAGVIGG
jgi:hypothetical protein